MAPRRKRVWARNTSIITSSTDGVAQDLTEDFNLEMGTNHIPVGCTIGGIMLDFTLSNGAVADEDDYAMLGILCTDESTATEVDTPLADPHADWMWWQLLPNAGTRPNAYSTFESIGGPIRIRSKRKCEELGSHLWLVFESSGLTTFELTYASSTLLLLP